MGCQPWSLEVPRRPRLDLYPGKGAHSRVPSLRLCPWFSWRSPGGLGWIFTQGKVLVPGYQGSSGAPGSPGGPQGTWAGSLPREGSSFLGTEAPSVPLVPGGPVGLGLSAMVPGGPQAASVGSLPREGCSFPGTKPQAVPLVLLEVPRRPRLDLYPGKGPHSWVPRLRLCPWFSWRSPGDLGWIFTQGRVLVPGFQGPSGAPGSPGGPQGTLAGSLPREGSWVGGGGGGGGGGA